MAIKSCILIAEKNNESYKNPLLTVIGIEDYIYA